MRERTPLPAGAAQTPPDYTTTSTPKLRVAQGVQLARLVSADFGHSIAQAFAFAGQVLDMLHGLRQEVDWEPDVEGVDPRLDQREKDAKRQLQAIQDELALRRSRRKERSDIKTEY